MQFQPTLCKATPIDGNLYVKDSKYFKRYKKFLLIKKYSVGYRVIYPGSRVPEYPKNRRVIGYSIPDLETLIMDILKKWNIKIFSLVDPSIVTNFKSIAQLQGFL